MTLTNFLAAKKGLLIAPAGHGKTHTIGNCVKMCPDNTVQLILTHTHAGINSLRSNFKSWVYFIINIRLKLYLDLHRNWF